MKRLGKLYKILAISLVVLIIFTGCGNKNKKSSDKGQGKLNIYTDVKDKHSLDIMKFAVDSYKKEKKELEININGSLTKDNIDKVISKEKDIDVVFTDRSNMLELSRLGLLSDMSNFYTKNDINDRFYNIVGTYGMVGDKYYGIGLIPYTIEVIYNEKAIKALDIADINNIKGLEELFQKIKSKGMKIPVVLTEDIDPIVALTGIIGTNIINNMELEKAYDSGVDKYKDIKSIQQTLEVLDSMIKSGAINREVFEKSDDNIVKKVEKGDYPIGIAISYYNKDILESDVKVITEYGVAGAKANMPIIINGILCISSNSKNQDNAMEFMKYLFSDKFQEELSKEGFVTGNKKACEAMASTSKDIETKIAGSNINSVIYIYNLPPKMRIALELEIEKISRGNYDGKEWEKVIKNYYSK